MITDEQKQACIQYIEEGMTNRDAATLAGFTESTFYYQLQTDSEFSESVKKAAVKFKHYHVHNIHAAAANRNWVASAWLLERKFKDEFAKLEKSENKNVNSDLPPTLEEVEAELERLRKEAAGD